MEPVAHPSGIPHEDRQWAMFCHFAGFTGFIIPLGNIIIPLVIWLSKKELSAYVNDQGKNVLNFQITFTVAAIICGITFFLIIPLLILVGGAIAWLILMIIGGINANEGKPHRYPYTYEFVK